MSDDEFGSLFETASSSDGEEQAQRGNDEEHGSLQTPLAGAHAACSSMAVIDTATAAGVMRCSSVPGLSVLPGFLDKQQQAHFRQHLEAELDAAGSGANQSMRFGNLPTWAQQLGALVGKAAAQHGMLPQQILSRQPLFDQFIVNLYRKGDGIKPHVDLMRFEDGICSVSFGDAAVMEFTHTTQQRSQQVLLQGGDLLMMHGDARYLWRHGIAGVQEERYMGDMPPWQQLHCALKDRALEEASGLGRAGPVGDDSSSNAAAAAALEMGAGDFEGQGCGSEGYGAGPGQVQGMQGWHQGLAQDGVGSSGDTGKAGEAGTAGSDRKACGQGCLVQDICVKRQGLEQGVRVVRGLRLSVTLRRLCSDIVLTEQ